ncbi:MAG TPA: hypothetical protein VJH97_06310 [Candidatus Nanoarchaeia archaeon]|nr:hypothetical protein [Candidatus Nanoarchaeia archaeon]
MSETQLAIAQYDLKEQTLRLHREYQRRFSDSENERPWRPMFTDLLEKYMAEHGWYCSARSSSGNGMNMSRVEDEVTVFRNQYVPLRPERDGYTIELERIVGSLAEDEERAPAEIMERIFAPLQRAEAAYKQAYDAYDEEKPGEVESLDLTTRKGYDRYGEWVKGMVKRKADHANKAWREAYDQKPEDYQHNDGSQVGEFLSKAERGIGGPFQVSGGEIRAKAPK